MMAAALLALAANYFLTTLAIWFGHWASHVWQPLRTSHVLGHHRLYAGAHGLRSERFRYGSGRHDSLIAQVPPHVAQALLLLFALPRPLFVICAIEMVALVAGFTWLHAQFHLTRPRFRRFTWFEDVRRAHDAHHRRDVNFMVADHSWDRVFGTYAVPPVGHAGWQAKASEIGQRVDFPSAES